MASSSSTNPASTRKSPISSIINRTSGTLPPHPYRRTPPPPTRGNKKQSSSFSRKSAPASGRSNDSSTLPMITPQNSKHSSRTRLSTQTSTGENSPGAQCCNGNNRCHHHRNDASDTPSASCSNRPIGYNPCADKSDYDDNKTPDITDLYGDKVYNNID